MLNVSDKYTLQKKWMTSDKKSGQTACLSAEGEDRNLEMIIFILLGVLFAESYKMKTKFSR